MRQYLVPKKNWEDMGSTQASLPPFLRLPLELRIPIYEIVFDTRLAHHPDTLLSILSVCKQIREESFPVLMRQNRGFQEFPAFIAWVEKGDPRRLQHVKDMLLNMLDYPWEQFPRCLKRAASRKVTTNDEPLDQRLTGDWWESRYAEMVQSERVRTAIGNAKKSKTSVFSKTSWNKDDPVLAQKSGLMASLSGSFRVASEYLNNARTKKEEDSFIARLFNALRGIHSTRRLWMVLRREAHPYPPMEIPDVERELVLEMLPVAMPLLEDLSVFSGITSLSYLRGLQNLKHLKFSGYSYATPEETLSILNSLPKFESLTLHRWMEADDANEGMYTEKLYQYQSITPTVIQNLKPLKSFSVTHFGQNNQSVYINSPMLNAALASKQHRQSLREVRISSNLVIDKDICDEFLRLLQGLDRLEVLYAQLDVRGLPKEFDFVRSLPEGVKTDGTDVRDRQTGYSLFSP